jgi:hypothetical protein
MADRPNRFGVDDAEVTRGFDRNAESWKCADRNVIPERPLRDRPLIASIELAGEHRGENPRGSME